MLHSPTQIPQKHGFKKGDTHVVVNAKTGTAKAFSFEGQKIAEIPCLAIGQDPNWRNNSGDTPPGLYKLGALYNDYGSVGDNPSYDRTLMSYGWQTYDMVDLEGNEDNNNRAGICWHGGGSGCGWPGAWLPKQALYPTLGCLRSHNEDLVDIVWKWYQQGTVFVSVYQDDV
jgi:hypothetical protein